MERRVFLQGLTGFVGLGLIGGSLAGCSTPPAGDPPKISFDHLPVFRLDVRDYKIVNRYQAPNTQPNIEHLLQQPTWVVMDNWARHRVQPIGPSGQAILTIQDARIVEETQTLADKFGPFSTTKMRYNYNARFLVRLDINAPAWDMRGNLTAEGRGTLQLPERLTLNKQDVALVQLVERAMADLDIAFERELRRNFSALLSG